MILGIAAALLALGLLLLGLAVHRERRLLQSTTAEAAEAVRYLESRVQTLDGRLEELGRIEDVAALFAETEAPRSSGRRRSRRKKRRSRS